MIFQILEWISNLDIETLKKPDLENQALVIQIIAEMNMKSNLAQEATPYNDCDFLIGDAVVIDQAMMNFNEIYQITEVYENTVNVYIGIGILILNKKFVRGASITELNANRYP